MKNNLDLTKIVGSYHFGSGSICVLAEIINSKHNQNGSSSIFFIDHFFLENKLIDSLPIMQEDSVFYVDSSNEPTTEQIDSYISDINKKCVNIPCCVIGIGGGTTMDIAKAVSVLLCNSGNAENYQGWNLVNNPGVFKIGIPTLSGTGAESSRTCVLLNKNKNIKLGINSPFTTFDHLILDPNLSATVPKKQFFYTAMDTYIHCIESLNGKYRHDLADLFSSNALKLLREVMHSDKLNTPENRKKLLIASYLGGSAIGNSFVGVVHPFSAGLSTVLGTHHCEANCITMGKMLQFYPDETNEFLSIVKKHKIKIPEKLCVGMTDDLLNKLYEACIIHEKPLKNALGSDYKNILSREKIINIYMNM